MTQSMIDLQQEAVKELVEIFKHKSEITFKAPTGSGKTIMMADFMNRILAKNPNVIFVVSSLSKGELALQNFKAFERFKNKFPYLKPFLIQSEDKGEGQIYIPNDYNVYVLPRDLYKEKSKLKQGAFVNFLRECKGFNSLEKSFQGYQEKTLVLIKDECHIATNNLDELIKKQNQGYFDKVINISATPKLSKVQNPDIIINESEAVQVGLIKEVKLIEEEKPLKEGLSEALKQFIELKKAYLEQIKINPCFIIQISNKEKAEAEILEIKKILSEKFSALKWILIMDKEKDCDSNDFFRVKNLPVKKWKNYAKENTSTIDIIIFKMVISEGWDIPRACMLYQVRDSKSKQLDEQVIGRVRRNPCLLDFERLDSKTQDLITKAYVWGIKPKNENALPVRLRGERFGGLFTNEIQKEFQIYTTKLKRTEQNRAFRGNVKELVKSEVKESQKLSIFELYERVNKNQELVRLCEDYMKEAKSENEAFKFWFSFNHHFENIKKQWDKKICDYENNIELIKPSEELLPFESVIFQTEFGLNRIKWIWQRLDGESEFFFDSKAERKWLEFLLDLCEEDNLVKSISLNEKKFHLLGKNFPYKSKLKFEYYFEGYHFSYPDFILKDCKDKIHIFEVKSVNKAQNQSIDEKEYDDKIKALKKCYKSIALKTHYHFYMPILKGENWDIWYSNEDLNLSKESFKELLKRA